MTGFTRPGSGTRKVTNKNEERLRHYYWWCDIINDKLLAADVNVPWETVVGIAQELLDYMGVQLDLPLNYADEG